MKKYLYILLSLLYILLYSSIIVNAQSSSQTTRRVWSGASDPAKCSPSGQNIFFNTTSGQLKSCTSTDTWTIVGGAGDTGSGTAGKIPVWVDTAVLGDSSISASGNVITFPNGSAVAPSIVGSDSDSGIYWTAAGKVIGFTVDGVAVGGIGASTASFYSSVIVLGPIGATSALQLQSNGVFNLLNDAGTGFGRLNLGPATSSSPALKRNNTTLAIRLADDSADAPVSASSITLSGQIQGTNTKALTESSATGFVDISVGSDASIGGVIDYTVQANDGSHHFQIGSGELYFTAINENGTVAGGASLVGTEQQSLSAASTLTNVFTVTNGSGKITVNCNSTSSLTQTTLQINFRVRVNSGTGTVTPL